MATDPKIAFQGEVQLLRWSDTSNAGATITLALSDHNDLEVFKLMTIKKGQQAGQRLACVMVEIADDESAVAQPIGDQESTGKGPYGQHYQLLFKRGWFFNPKVQAAFAPDNSIDQIKAKFYNRFGVASLAEIVPGKFVQMVKMLGLADTLPRGFGE